MKISYLCLLALSALLFWSCASRYSSPILIERGEGRKEFEREYFVVKESMGIDKRLKDVFKQGYIEEGMTNDMVNLLWGPPDHETETASSGSTRTSRARRVTKSNGSSTRSKGAAKVALRPRPRAAPATTNTKKCIQPLDNSYQGALFFYIYAR